MRARVGLPLLMTFVLLAGTLGAQSAIPYVGYSPQSGTAQCLASTKGTVYAPTPGATIALTLIALLVGFDVVVLGFLFSKMVPSAGIGNWLKNEYYELAKSAILIVAIYSAITIVSGIGLVLAYNPNNVASTPPTGSIANVGGLIDESEYYLCTVQGNLGAAWDFVGQISFALGFVQDMKVGLSPGFPLIWDIGGFQSGFAANPYHTFMLESGNLIIQHFESTIFDFLQFVLFPVSTMIVGFEPLIPYLVWVGLSIMIPTGLIFRAFPFVRGVGGTLIAIGIATSVIFPAVLILLDQPIAAQAQSIMPPYTPSPPSQQCSGSWICNVFSFFLNMPQFKLLESFGLQGFTYYSLAAFQGIYPFFNGIMQSGFYIIVQLLLLAADIIIIYQLTDSIAKMLGGTIRLSLGNKLKLA